MLLACANVAPRGVFVTATGVTTSGLTVTLSREAGNEFVLEAGALVLADQGDPFLSKLTLPSFSNDPSLNKTRTRLPVKAYLMAHFKNCKQLFE
jgi:hypothetical protein